MADPKWESLAFVQANGGMAEHIFDTVADAEDARRPNHVSCKIEPGHESCSTPAPKTIEVLVACAPCQPYSKLSRSTACPTTHNLYYTIHGDTGGRISFCTAFLPLAVVSENVLGLLQCRAGRYRDHPPVEHIVQRMMVIRDGPEKHFVDVKVIKCCSSAFVAQKRQSFFIKM